MWSRLTRLFTLMLAIALLSAMCLPAMAEDDRPEKLSVLIWGGAESQAEYDAAIKNHWTPLYPDIDVEVIVVPYADHSQKLLTMIATDSAPDVFWMDNMYWHQWHEAGYMADLSALAEDAEYDYADFVSSMAVAAQADGKIWSVPFSGAPQVLFYNKTLVEKAGLETPNELYAKGEWTSDKMYEYAIKLTDPDNGIYGVNYTRSALWTSWGTYMFPVIRAFGGGFWSEDFSTVLLNSDEAIEGMQMWGDLMFEHKAHPQPGDAADFFAGKCALYPSLLGDMRKCVDLDFEWDLAPMPFADDGSYTAYQGVAYMAAYADGEYVDYAVELVKVLTGKGVINELRDLYISPRVSILNSEAFISGNNGEIPRPSEEHFRQAVTDHSSVIRVQEQHPNMDLILDVMMNHVEAFFMQMETAEECLNYIAEETEQYMIK